MSVFHDLKEYFNFNRGERRGLVVLLTLLLAFIAAGRLMPFFLPDASFDFTEFERTAQAFESRQALIRDSINQQQIHQNTRKASVEETKILKPFPFDPNGLPADEWLKMGLTAKQVRVIKNYEKKGGRFETPKDLGKIYSLSEEDFKVLLPFIRIGEKQYSVFVVYPV